MSSPFVRGRTKEKRRKSGGKAKEKRRKKAKTGAKWDVMKKGQCYSKVMEKKDET